MPVAPPPLSTPSLWFSPRTARRWFSALTGSLLGAALLLTSLTDIAHAKPKVHVVYQGQRLGSIAKRYNVTVDELCAANNISRRAPIQPGQKLIIPGTDDGSKGGDENDEKKSDSAKSEPSRPTGKATIHVVAKGHTLSAISGRYGITVGAICNANGITRQTSLRVGQKLVVPHKSDKDGEYARKQRQRGKYDEKLDDDHDEDADKEDKSRKSSAKTWEKYVKPAWRRGYIKIRRYGRSWEGYVIGPKNQVLGHASNKINFVMGAREDGPRIDPKLVRLIASISDKFGGREMRIVSGYRTKSFVAASKHKQGKALDFSIPGVPNEALRDYLRTIDGVGVGFYPNSSFVHLDVRGYNSYWIDYSGPGEAPRTRKRTPKDHDDQDHDHGADDDGAEEADSSDGDTSKKDPDTDSTSKKDGDSGSTSKKDPDAGSTSKKDPDAGSTSKKDGDSGSTSPNGS